MRTAGWLPCALFATIWCYYGTCGEVGSDDPPIKDWLGQPILAPDQPQQEVERYLEARIPKLPAISSRQEWERQAQEIRTAMLEKVVLRGRGREWRDASLRIDWQEVIHGGEEYRIKKLRFEALPGLWIPALLYEPLRPSSKMPVSLNINGHDANGKAAVYKQTRCINQAKRGILALNVEWLGMGQLRQKDFSHTRMNQLDLCGTSGLAPFYLAMKRGLDVLLAHPHADAQRVAVSGLSGGGWQTIFISSLDTRVTLANPVAGYSSFLTRIHNHSDLGDSEQTPSDMATVGDYAHLTALLAPRAALLTYNVKDDCCFASGHALQPLLDAATPIYRLFGQESRLRSHVNHDPGTHNFEKDNREAFYRMLVDHFFPGQSGISATEIDCPSEIKTAEELQVSLPAENAGFNTLARRLAEGLPGDADLPTEAGEVTGWQTKKRALLKETIHFQEYSAVAEKVFEQSQSGVTARGFRMRLSDAWTVPVVEFSPSKAEGSTILAAESGRETLGNAVRELLEKQRRVIVVDPFYFGESKLKNRAYLWGLLIQAVGDRPAGLQASQMVAIARGLKQQYPSESVELDARGTRLTLAALCAGALEPNAIDVVRLHECLPSLRDVITDDYGFDTHPELFPFGLLERYDIRSIAALYAPREVQFVLPTERHRAELATLADWYKLIGKDFNPTK